jgi:hypothetical protein
MSKHFQGFEDLRPFPHEHETHLSVSSSAPLSAGQEHDKGFTRHHSNVPDVTVEAVKRLHAQEPADAA